MLCKERFPKIDTDYATITLICHDYGYNGTYAIPSNYKLVNRTYTTDYMKLEYPPIHEVHKALLGYVYYLIRTNHTYFWKK